VRVEVPSAVAKIGRGRPPTTTSVKAEDSSPTCWIAATNCIVRMHVGADGDETPLPLVDPTSLAKGINFS
jgi:hypothetical protein